MPVKFFCKRAYVLTKRDMKHILERTFFVAVGMAVAWGLLRYAWIKLDFLPPDGARFSGYFLYSPRH